MRFTVPQFIEHEAKIIGPLTFKQLTYVGSAVVIGFILYHQLPGPVFLPVAIILALGSSALAFLKINGLPLPIILTNCFKFFLSSKVYLWQKTKIKTQRKINVEIFEKSYPAQAKQKMKEENLSSSPSEPLKLIKTSYLKKLNTKIETK